MESGPENRNERVSLQQRFNDLQGRIQESLNENPHTRGLSRLIMRGMIVIAIVSALDADYKKNAALQQIESLERLLVQIANQTESENNSNYVKVLDIISNFDNPIGLLHSDYVGFKVKYLDDNQVSDNQLGLAWVENNRPFQLTEIEINFLGDQSGIPALIIDSAITRPQDIQEYINQNFLGVLEVIVEEDSRTGLTLVRINTFAGDNHDAPQFQIFNLYFLNDQLDSFNINPFYNGDYGQRVSILDQSVLSPEEYIKIPGSSQEQYPATGIMTYDSQETQDQPASPAPSTSI